MLTSNVSTGGIFFANKMRTQGYVTMLDPLQVCHLFCPQVPGFQICLVMPWQLP